MKRMNFPERKETRRVEAQVRNEDWAKLSTSEKLAELDRRLGVGQGATKQREKLG